MYVDPNQLQARAVKKEWCLAFLLLLVCLPVAAAPKIQHWQTDDGAGVYFVPLRGLPIVDVAITFDAGSARDPKGKEPSG